MKPDGYAGAGVKPYETSFHQLSPDRRRIATLAGEGEARDILVTDLNFRTAYPHASARSHAEWPGLESAGTVPGGKLAHRLCSDRQPFRPDKIRPRHGNDISVEDVSFSPDGKLLAATDRGGSTWLWDIANKKKDEQPLPGEADRAYKPTFSPDGEFLSVVYANGRARVFSVNGNPQGGLARLGDIWGEISSVSFSPDAKTTVAVYARGTLAMWDNGSWFPERRLPIGYELSNA